MKKIVKRISVFSGIILLALLISIYFKQNVLEESAYARTSQTTTEKAAIDSWLLEENFSGTAIVMRNGQEIFSSSYGYSDFSTNKKNTSSALFPVASLQKMMTAVLIAQVIAAGQLTYETPLSDFYPEIAGSAEITIRDLLNQTSGIEMAESAPAELLTTELEQLSYTLNHLVSTNAEDFHYTNANYTLLAGILATVSQKSYEELLTEKIIEPLNLADTYFWDTVPTTAVVANAYENSLFGPQIGADNFSDAQNLFSSLLGAGNLLMTTEDLVKVLQAITNGTLLTTAELNELLTTDGSYGGAFWQSNGTLQTNGGLGDYSASVYFNLTGDDLVILLSNSGSETSLSDLAPEIYQNYLE